MTDNDKVVEEVLELKVLVGGPNEPRFPGLFLLNVSTISFGLLE